MANFAADVVREAIVEKRDVKISYQLLRDIAVLPRATQILLQPQQLTPSTQEHDGLDRQARMVASVLLESRENFGTELPPRVKEKLAELEKEQ